MPWDLLNQHTHRGDTHFYIQLKCTLSLVTCITNLQHFWNICLFLFTVLFLDFVFLDKSEIQDHLLRFIFCRIYLTYPCDIISPEHHQKADLKWSCLQPRCCRVYITFCYYIHFYSHCHYSWKSNYTNTLLEVHCGSSTQSTFVLLRHPACFLINVIFLHRFLPYSCHAFSKQCVYVAFHELFSGKHHYKTSEFKAEFIQRHFQITFMNSWRENKQNE